MRKRVRALWLTLCLALTLVVPVRAAETVLTVNAPDTLPGVGKTLTVTVDISGNPGVSSVQFTLTYDKSMLECTGIEPGAVLNGTQVASNFKGREGAMIAAASDGELTGDGELAVFTFKVKKSGTPAFTVASPLLCRDGGNEVSVSVIGAEVKDAGRRNDPEAYLPADDPEEEELPVAEPEEEPEEELPEEAGESLFTDTAGHPNELYINEAVERGFFQGYADGGFKPNGNVTRGAFVTVLWRMAGRPEPAAAAPFTDIGHVSEEFRSAIAWAYEKGYINGRSATAFAPGDPMSRQATMKILFHHYGGGSGMEETFRETYDAFFTDSAALNEQFKAPMYWGIYNGLIEGRTENTLGGPTVADRALLATVLVKYTDRFGA